MEIKVSNIHTAMKLMDEKRGASWEPFWVDKARRRGERVQMLERDYWINYTNRVSYNRVFTDDEWTQVKIFNLPKKTLKLQVHPVHWDVFLSTAKLIKPRRRDSNYKSVFLQISLNGRFIKIIFSLYGIFDDSNISKDFELLETGDAYNDTVLYEYKNAYLICQL